MILKPCTGCKFLVRGSNGFRGCRANETYKRRDTGLTDPLTGEPILRPIEWRHTIHEARSDDGECGPEARLYDRGSWLRLFLRWLAPW